MRNNPKNRQSTPFGDYRVLRLSGGAYTLTLSGTPGAFRIWPDATGTNAPLLECGQAVTNGAGGVSFLAGPDTGLHVEAVSNGVATLTYAFAGDGEAWGLTCSAALKMTAWGLEFVEDAGTRYNFSPALGETGTVKVAAVNLPEGGMPGHHFRIEIVRETAGGGEQHIDWLDMTEGGTHDLTRPADFTAMPPFRWGGVPSQGFGSSAPQAEGRDSFQGVSGSAVRALPAVTVGQPVPPPFVTAVATVRRNSDQTVVASARRRIFVPQVVKLVYESAAIATIKAGYQVNITNIPTYLMAPMSDSEWETQRNRIRALAQTYYDGVGINIRFVDSEMVLPPYSTLTMENSLGPLGFAPGDYLNTNPSDNGILCAATVPESIFAYYYNQTTAGNDVPIPVTAREIGYLWGHVVAHETGHLLGLVAPGPVLDGTPVGSVDDETGWHNTANSLKRVMNAGGGNNQFNQMTNRDNLMWGWMQKNAAYLRFLLPKEEE